MRYAAVLMSDLSIRSTLSEHLKSRKLRETAQKMEDRYKNLLKDILAAEGEEDEKGSFHYPFDDEFYDPDGKLVTGLKSTKRQTRSLDEEAAQTILADLGYLQACQEHVVVLNEDAILALNFEGKISDEDLKKMYVDGKPNWALNVLR